jgi:hypothetical protein
MWRDKMALLELIEDTDESLEEEEDEWTEPAFPLEILPTPVLKMVGALAEAHGVPVDMPAMIALGAISVLTAQGVSIQPWEGWETPANLYITVIAGVGESKSPVVHALTTSLYGIESKRVARSAMAIKRAEALYAAADKKVKKLTDKLASGTGGVTDQDLIQAVIARDSLVIPPSARFITMNTTPEALVTLAASTGGTMSVVSDEGGEVFQMMARYSAGGKANLGAYLQGYDGLPYREDRIGRGSTAIDRLCLSVCLTVQPSVIEEISADKVNRDRGLLGRFLMVQPKSSVGYRPTDRPPVPGDVAYRWNEMIGNLADLLLPAADAEPVVLQLSPDAVKAFKEWQATVEPRLREFVGDLRTVVDWGNKAQGHVIRLAAVLHIANLSVLGYDQLMEPVSAPEIESAIKLWEYVAQHTIKIFSEFGDDPAVNVAKKIWRWIQNRAIEEFTQREAHHAVSGGIVADAEDVKAGLLKLVSGGYVAQVPVLVPAAGRPPSPKYQVLRGGRHLE